MKYTVSINYGEYCQGLFETEEQANAYRASRVRQDEPDAMSDMTDEEVLDEFDIDGYYRTMKVIEEVAE